MAPIEPICDGTSNAVAVAAAMTNAIRQSKYTFN